MCRQMETRVNPRMMSHMQKHTQLDRGYSSKSTTETPDNEEEAKDKCERMMHLMELREMIELVELEVAVEARVKHMESLLCNMEKYPNKKAQSDRNKVPMGIGNVLHTANGNMWGCTTKKARRKSVGKRWPP